MQSTLKQIALSLCVLGAISTVDASPALNIQPRIVGGDSVDISSAPATVALINNRALSQTGSYFQAQFCGGTVIGARWVLTAAHCLITDSGTVPASNVSVLMGSTDLNNPINQPIGVTRIIAHSAYNDRNNANDIALLQLEYNALVAPTPLDNQTSALNDLAYIVGWGAINAGDNGQAQQFPTQLRGAYVRMVPGNDCALMFDQYAGLVDDSNLCAGRAEGGVDTCQGDSGGPLYRYNEANPAVMNVSGITSWGFGCGDAQTPGVYTRVAAYNAWIQSHTGITPAQPGSALPVNDPVPTVPVQPTVQTPVQPGVQPGAPAPATHALNLGDTGGGATFYLLPLFAAALGLRRRRPSNAPKQSRHLTSMTNIHVSSDNPATRHPRHQPSQRVLRCYPAALVITLLAVLALVLWSQPGDAQNADAKALNLASQPIGQPRDSVMPDAEHLWQQQPVCTLLRTGYGLSKRAYFLETCTFASTSHTTLCMAKPTWIEYRFLEDKLVQIAFEFDTQPSSAEYQPCIEQQYETIKTAPDNGGVKTVTVDDSYRTVLADVESVRQIHSMKKAN